ncbi:MAG: c-type cytochrome [Planctomycetes bacterium]|nr:c-type cytochrome [Planctomycetota bacterium]
MSAGTIALLLPTAALSWLVAPQPQLPPQEIGSVHTVAEPPAVLPGFVAELVVAHPQVKWPSAVHVREDGALLIGEDPMDMPGPTDQPIDKLWLLRFGADGSWTKSLFCDQLYAVMGIQEIDDAIYVMNMPNLTVLRDRDGDGIAEERRELLTDLGPKAPGWPDGFNDHIVTGLRLGMDGWLYVSVGDKGIPGAHGTDGSTIQLRGGGVVRLRPDGSELEVVASGTRNHLDVAMDERDTIFTYDNTDDGLGWWTRFTHVMPTGYYGYPWDYHDHTERMLPCMRDDGGGSGVGALVYNEAAWPEEFRGAVFCCDWADRAIRKYTVEPDGATFKCTGVADFMSQGHGGEFRPLDIAESPDGRYLYVADWNHPGWRANDVVGRVWRVRLEDDVPGPAPIGGLADGTMAARAKASVSDLLANLGHPSFRRRVAAQRELAKRARDGLDNVSPNLLATIANSVDERPRRHAVWAFAESTRRANGGGSSSDSIGPLAMMLASSQIDGRDESRAELIRALGQRRERFGSAAIVGATESAIVRREAAIAIGRIGDVKATRLLIDALATTSDRFLCFAIRQALRSLAVRRDFDFDTLLRTQLPAAPSSAQAEVWLALRELYDVRLATALATAAFESSLAPSLRASALVTLASIEKREPSWDGKWWETQPANRPRPAKTETWDGSATVGAALEHAFATPQPPELRGALATIARESRNPALFPHVRALALQSADPAERAALITLLAELRDVGSAELCRTDLGHASPVVRAAAATALAALVGAIVRNDLLPLLDDGDAAVRAAARIALARWPKRDELGAFVAGLSASPAEREACRGALVVLGQAIRGELEQLATRGVLAGDALADVRSIYSDPQPLLKWELLGPFTRAHHAPTLEGAALGRAAEEIALPSTTGGHAGLPIAHSRVTAELPHGFVDLRARVAARHESSAYALTVIDAPRARTATVALGSDDGVTVWLNGTQVHQNLGDRGWGPDQDRFEVALAAGKNELLVRIEQAGGDWSFNVKLSEDQAGPLFDGAVATRPAEIAFDLATWRAFALANAGDPARGKALFHHERGPGCFRCHAVAGVGPKVGPDLRDVGKKYARAELVTSLLEPSQRILDGYRATNLFLKSGDILSGLVIGDANGDAQGRVAIVEATGRTREVDAAEIATRKESKLSAMPSGLAEPLTRQELADVIAWLETLRD